MPKLTKIFPNLSKARALLNQHAYDQAIELYSEILLKDGGDEERDGEKGVEEKDGVEERDGIEERDGTKSEGIKKENKTAEKQSMHKHISENKESAEQAGKIGYKAYIYIEYAHCLIKNVSNYFQTLLHCLNTHQPSILQKKEIYEEDLEIAWNVLEQARLYFKMKNDTHQLKKVYFLQGEIYLLNDQYADAIKEFSNCLLVNDEQFVNDGTVYKRIGDSYFFLGDKAMATTFYEKGMVYYNGVGNAKKSREVEILLMSAREKEEMGFRDDEEQKESKEVENEKVVVDVTHLIRKKEL